MSAQASASWPVSPAAPLEGRIVRLEPLARRHSAGLRAAARSPEIWTWVGHPPAESATTWTRWFDAALDAAQSGDDVVFATVDASDGTPLGMTRFQQLRPADRGLEIGATWLTPRAWNTGANVEAKLLQMTHAFERLRCIRVELKTHAANARARAAILALGASFEGVHRKHRIVPGVGVRDTAWYSVIDDEWPRVKELLRARLAASGGLTAADEARPVA